jgi:hypothetical protein
MMAENKMDQATTMNNFDKLLGRNGELVELRKEQVLAGAMRIIQQYYADKQNKMEAVAKLFGRNLGEEFWARIVGKKFEIKCRFAASGFQQTVVAGLWHDNDAFLSLLLTGRAEIVEDER